DIFHDYYDYIRQKFDSEQEILRNIHSPHMIDLEKSLKTQAGQVEVLKYIFGNVRVSRGRSYGRPWVNYTFKKGSYKDPKDLLPDALFYRIDKKKKGFYISLRQYKNLKKKVFQDGKAISLEQLKVEKLERLQQLTNIIDEVMAEIKSDYPENYILPNNNTTAHNGFDDVEVREFNLTEGGLEAIYIG